MRLQFQFEGDRPPFVYAPSAAAALRLCRELVRDSAEQLLAGEQQQQLQRQQRLGVDSSSSYSGSSSSSRTASSTSAGTVTVTVIDELRGEVADWYVRVYGNINNRVGYTLQSFG